MTLRRLENFPYHMWQGVRQMCPVCCQQKLWTRAEYSSVLTSVLLSHVNPESSRLSGCHTWLCFQVASFCCSSSWTVVSRSWVALLASASWCSFCRWALFSFCTSSLVQKSVFWRSSSDICCSWGDSGLSDTCQKAEFRETLRFSLHVRDLKTRIPSEWNPMYLRLSRTYLQLSQMVSV